MKYRYCIVPLLVTILLIAAGCQIGPAPLSQQQLQEFIRENHIQPLAVEEVGGKVTVILHKDAKHMGCYIVWAGNGIESMFITTMLNTPQNRSAIKPLSMVYKPVLGSDIVCMTINDRNVQKKAFTVKIIFSENSEMIVPIQNHGNMIISQPTERFSGRVDIVIYDRDKNEILRY